MSNNVWSFTFWNLKKKIFSQHKSSFRLPDLKHERWIVLRKKYLYVSCCDLWDSFELEQFTKHRIMNGLVIIRNKAIFMLPLLLCKRNPFSKNLRIFLVSKVFNTFSFFRIISTVALWSSFEKILFSCNVKSFKRVFKDVFSFEIHVKLQ